MRVRLIEDYNPVTQETWHVVQQLTFLGWFDVDGTLSSSSDEARKLWERVKTFGVKRDIRVKDSAKI